MESIKSATFMFGLPGSGKTTWINQRIWPTDTVFVSADDIRVAHPDYDPLYPELLQDVSVALAKQKVGEAIDKGQSFVMDAGGINNKYTSSLVKLAREASYVTRLVHIDTPLVECLKRNDIRRIKGERFVPKDAIISKHERLYDALANIKPLVNKYEVILYYENTHLFLDMDGVTTVYQSLPYNQHGNIDFVNHHVFRDAKPVQVVIDKARDYSSTKTVYILSAAANSLCIDDKLDWLARYMPWVKRENIFFVGNKKYKIVMLDSLMKARGLTTRQVVLVEDNHSIIRDAIPYGINCIHVSKFLGEGL